MNEAKLEVARDVPIDLPGGPSEVVVVGDGDENLISLELAAQQEHGAESVCRRVATLAEAEAMAPEHLVLLGEAERDADRVRNAAAVFVGPWSAVAAGDYATGGQPRPAHRGPRALDRRARARGVPQAGDRAARCRRRGSRGCGRRSRRWRRRRACRRTRAAVRR